MGKSVMRIVFQFHEGPIKTEQIKREPILHNGFNSMKVRLKPEHLCNLDGIGHVSIP